MFTLKNVLIILLLVTIVWIIYLFIKTLKTSATTGSFQKKLAERKKRLENQKTREQKAEEKAQLKAEIAKKRAEWKAEDEEKEAVVKAELEELLAKKKEIEPEWKRICKEYKANPTAYAGNVADACNIVRLAITGRTTTPDLCSIMKLLGETTVKERLTNMFNSLI